MNQATLLTTLGCSGSLAATLLFTQPALAAPDAPQVALAGHNSGAIAQVQSDCLATAHLGYTSDESLTDALGCACALCNPNRERPTTAPIQ
ncbi:MAG: hypothetical protein F6J87_15175 [Spirulina sp. SIO3F2]|nr:hypothetical protein [Spirulina sp. SIO3F2]